MLAISSSLPDNLVIQRSGTPGAHDALVVLDAFDLLSGKLEAELAGQVLRNSRVFVISGDTLRLNDCEPFHGRIEVSIGDDLTISILKFEEGRCTKSEESHRVYDEWDQGWGE